MTVATLYLCGMFAELAGWSWQRFILAMHKGGNGGIEIQAIKELKKIFKGLMQIRIRHFLR